MARVYQIFVLVFLLQGISLPFLLLLFRFLWHRQERSRRSRRAPKSYLANRVSELNRGEFRCLEIGSKKKKAAASHQISESVLNSTPHLEPLKCTECGSGVLLRETETVCPYCQTRGDLPKDYAKTMSLKSKNKMLLKRALAYWRAANVLTLPELIGVFIALAILEPLFLTPAVINGADKFPNNSVENLLAPLGDAAVTAFYSLSSLGVFIWTLGFLCFAVEGVELRRKLPIVPVLDEPLPERETANCQSCGGAIEYDAADFACLCPYCNVENFRVRFTRIKGAHAAEQKEQINFALYGAMEIIEYFVTLLYSLLMVFAFVPMLLYAAGLLIYALAYGLIGTFFVTLVLLAVLMLVGKLVKR